MPALRVSRVVSHTPVETQLLGDVKAAFDSLEVHSDKSEAVLTAKVPYAFFKKVLTEPPVQLGPEKQTPATPDVPPSKGKSPKAK